MLVQQGRATSLLRIREFLCFLGNISVNLPKETRNYFIWTQGLIFIWEIFLVLLLLALDSVNKYVFFSSHSPCFLLALTLENIGAIWSTSSFRVGFLGPWFLDHLDWDKCASRAGPEAFVKVEAVMHHASSISLLLLFWTVWHWDMSRQHPLLSLFFSSCALEYLAGKCQIRARYCYF